MGGDDAEEKWFGGLRVEGLAWVAGRARHEGDHAIALSCESAHEEAISLARDCLTRERAKVPTRERLLDMRI